MNNNLQNAKLEPVWHTNKFIFALIFFLVTLFFFFPFINPSNFQLHLMIMIFMYAVMTQSWNVIAGFSGGAGFRFTNMTLDVGFMNLGPAGFVMGFSLMKKMD